MKIFGMVTTKGSWEYTSYALKSFLRTAKLSSEDTIYLIDNDGAFEEEASWFSPRLEIIKNERPLGFAANMNKVMERADASGADLFILHNDIVFTEGWLDPLVEGGDALTSSISNAHTEFENSPVNWEQSLKLNHYLGRESIYKELIKQHREKSDGYKRVLSLPFFCLRIPEKIYRAVGRLDEKYEGAGSEDHDYCLRVYQAGFEVQYSKKSLVIHFAGKSTWGGGERPEQTAERQQRNRETFREKWGAELDALTAEANSDALSGELREAYSSGDYSKILETLIVK